MGFNFPQQAFFDTRAPLTVPNCITQINIQPKTKSIKLLKPQLENALHNYA